MVQWLRLHFHCRGCGLDPLVKELRFHLLVVQQLINNWYYKSKLKPRIADLCGILIGQPLH